jgi:hypothetical protein
MMPFRLSFRRGLLIFLLTAAFAISAFAAETVAGVVINQTTGRPAAGDDVALLSLDGNSMEVSRGKTAADGSFQLRTFVLGKHLLRIRHDGLIYQQEVISGARAEVKVFDVASRLDGIHEKVTITKIESRGRNLSVSELHSIVNDSDPPRTLANASNLEILLPPRAVLDQVLVQGSSSQPEKVKPKPVAAGSRRYAVGYPLRPGATRFAVMYHLPNSDRAILNLRLQYPTDLWTLVLPESMDFRASDFRTSNKTNFREIMTQQDVKVEALTHVPAGALPQFRISGSGTFPQVDTRSAAAYSVSSHASSSAAPKAGRDTSQPAGFRPKLRRAIALCGTLSLALLTGIFLARRRLLRRRGGRVKEYAEHHSLKKPIEFEAGEFSTAAVGNDPIRLRTGQQ